VTLKGGTQKVNIFETVLYLRPNGLTQSDEICYDNSRGGVTCLKWLVTPTPHCWFFTKLFLKIKGGGTFLRHYIDWFTAMLAVRQNNRSWQRADWIFFPVLSYILISVYISQFTVGDARRFADAVYSLTWLITTAGRC